VVATLLTMVVVPILYWELRRRDEVLPVGPPAPELTDEDAHARLQRPRAAADLVTA
jgi:hypothetical protein